MRVQRRSIEVLEALLDVRRSVPIDAAMVLLNENLSRTWTPVRLKKRLEAEIKARF
jgi:hypothetical protein